LLLSSPQDVDAAYMGRMDLHGKVDSLTQEIDFLQQLFEMVRRQMGSHDLCTFIYHRRVTLGGVNSPVLLDW
jgi:hypothetical protein